MTITKTSENCYQIEGLTEAKLMAVESALKAQKENGTLTFAGTDVLLQVSYFLHRINKLRKLR